MRAGRRRLLGIAVAALSACGPASAPPVTLPPAPHAVVLLAEGQELEMLAAPDSDKVIETLFSNEVGFTAAESADPASAGWFLVTVDGKTGWVDGLHLTMAIPNVQVWQDQENLVRLIDELASSFEGEPDALPDVLGPKGLYVSHFDHRPGAGGDTVGMLHWPARTNPLTDQSLYEWPEEAGEPPWPTGTFSEVVVPSFLGVYRDPDLVVAALAAVSGPEAAMPYIPYEFRNFPFIALHDRGDLHDFSGLDWTTWYVFFDYVPKPTIVGLSIDGWAP